MSAKQHKEQPPPPDKPKGPAPAAQDPRDAAIERLERALLEERENAAALRKSNDEFRFKTEILEKGYTKQLADARARMDAAERQVAEHKTKQATLGTGGEDTLRLLSDTRAELAQMKMERDQARAQLARREGRAAERDAGESSGTINALILGVSALREEKVPAGGSAHLTAKVQAEDDSPSEDMIAPELVFTKGSKDDDED